MDEHKLLKMAEFADEPELATMHSLLRIEEEVSKYGDKHSEGLNRALSEVISYLEEKIVAPKEQIDYSDKFKELSEQTDYNDKFKELSEQIDSLMEKDDEEIEVTLNIL